MDSLQKKCRKMNRIFKKSRSVSPSFEIPKICLPRQAECVDDGFDPEINATLSVPAESRGRSSSFDSSSLQRQSTLESQECLEVPTKQGRRCHSFDSACTLQIKQASVDDAASDSGSSNWSLKVPKYQSRRHSFDIPKLCIHCIHIEAKLKEEEERREALQLYEDSSGPDHSDNISFTSSTSYTSTTPDSSLERSGFYYLSDSEDEGNESDCEDNLDSPNYTYNLNPKCEVFDGYQINRRYSEKLSPGSKMAPNSDSVSILEILNGHSLKHIDSKDDEELDILDGENDVDDDIDDDDDEDYINAVTLTVPTLKHRSSSMDACFMKTQDCGKTSPKQVQRQKSFDVLDVPLQFRSSSVDVALPTDQESHYKAIPNSNSR